MKIQITPGRTLQREILKQIQRHIKHRWKTRLFEEWHDKGDPALGIYSRKILHRSAAVDSYLGHISISSGNIGLHAVVTGYWRISLDDPNCYTNLLKHTNKLWPHA